MCDVYNEKTIKTALSKARSSDYRSYFPDLNFDPLEQLEYIENMVETLRKEEATEEKEIHSIEKDIERNKNNDSQLAILDAASNHYIGIFMRNDALRANIQIAMLAPAIEGLYKKSLTILIKEEWGKEKLDIFFKKKDSSFEGDIVSGIVNILKKLNIQSYFSNDIEKYLSALFSYRNELFHNGLEWKKEKCQKVLNNEHKKGWFTLHADSRGPYFILPTRKFIDELITFFEESINGLAEARKLQKKLQENSD